MEIFLLALLIMFVLWCLYKGTKSINGASYGPSSFASDIALAGVLFAGSYGVLKLIVEVLK